MGDAIRARIGLRTDEGKQRNPELASNFLVVYEPTTKSAKSISFLKAWIKDHLPTIHQQQLEYGGVLFRGFDLTGPQDFEDVAKLVSKKPLVNTYLGTSPRLGVTEYVFNASEFPNFFPIPQHVEMSFLPTSAPSYIFFCCLTPPRDPSMGETALCDFRRVHDRMNPEVRERFEQKGIKNIRNYCSKESKADLLTRLDPFRTKAWEDIFCTTDKKKVEEMCSIDGVTAVWKGPDNNDLELVNDQPAFSTHPETNRRYWCNHTQVFHITSIPAEFLKVALRQNRLLMWFLCIVCWAIILLKMLFTRNPHDFAMHSLHTGTKDEPIKHSDIQHVRDVIWDNMVFFDWRKGDILCLDNRAIAHGRMPYRGKERRIVTCFA